MGHVVTPHASRGRAHERLQLVSTTATLHLPQGKSAQQSSVTALLQRLQQRSGETSQRSQGAGSALLCEAVQRACRGAEALPERLAMALLEALGPRPGGGCWVPLAGRVGWMEGR